ncbi:hypothetical protein [Nocardia brasiliensis]|uniref:hypothetical protein n=1 Tax=Nocardia brasiliensis TaxID=37326 RepID=UPI00366B1CD7
MALTRNPDSVQIYSDAAVYVGKTLNPTRPATINDPFDATWDNLGILNGDSGITNSREWDVTEHFGWGIGLYRKGFKNYKEARVVTCLESNETTRRIARPGSSATNIVVPRPGLFPLAFEFTNDAGLLEREFTARPAQCWIPNLDRNESDPTSYEITADIFARGDGLLYVRQYTPVNEVQNVVIVGGPTGGAFTLSYDGAASASLDFDATNAEVQAALAALPGIGAGNVTVTGTAPNFVVSFATGALAGTSVQLLVAVDTLTGGTDPHVKVEPA